MVSSISTLSPVGSNFGAFYQSCIYSQKCSWRWASLSPETCRIDSNRSIERSIKENCCILLVAYIVVLRTISQMSNTNFTCTWVNISTQNILYEDHIVLRVFSFFKVMLSITFFDSYPGLPEPGMENLSSTRGICFYVTVPRPSGASSFSLYWQ